MPRFAKTRNIIGRRSSRLLAKLVQVVWRNHFLLWWHGNVSHDPMWYAETKRLLQRWSLFGQVRLIIQTQSLLGQWLRSCQWCFLSPSLLMQFMWMTWSPTFWSRSIQERSLRKHSLFNHLKQHIFMVKTLYARILLLYYCQLLDYRPLAVCSCHHSKSNRSVSRELVQCRRVQY